MITIKRFCIIALVASLCFSFSACDKHIDFPDTAVKPCHILCTDGKVLPVEDFEQSDKQAIAVVFHINHDENIEGNGYAVYLWDLLPLMLLPLTAIPTHSLFTNLMKPLLHWLKKLLTYGHTVSQLIYLL